MPERNKPQYQVGEIVAYCGHPVRITECRVGPWSAHYDGLDINNLLVRGMISIESASHEMKLQFTGNQVK